MVCVNDGTSIEYKRRVVEFWKLDDTMKPKSLNGVKHRFRKVITPVTKNQINRSGSRVE